MAGAPLHWAEIKKHSTKKSSTRLKSFNGKRLRRVFEECHGFTGEEYDPDTGLYYYNARWYDADIGRFISEDPGRDPNNPNLYVYGMRRADYQDSQLIFDAIYYPDDSISLYTKFYNDGSFFRYGPIEYPFSTEGFPVPALDLLAALTKNLNYLDVQPGYPNWWGNHNTYWCNLLGFRVGRDLGLDISPLLNPTGISDTNANAAAQNARNAKSRGEIFECTESAAQFFANLGNFVPIVFKGLGKYFILNRNDSKIIILDTMNHIISIPDANSIISIFGVRLWKKKNNFGVPITMYPIEEKVNIIWGEDSVSSKVTGLPLEQIRDSKEKGIH